LTNTASSGKRWGAEVARAYVGRYTRGILEPAELERLAAVLPSDGPTAFMCVARDTEACHRSLIEQRLADEHGLAVSHLRP
jgi:uncharacterized protein (DUF488 family)